MFREGYIKDVVFLPSSSIAHRYIVSISGLQRDIIDKSVPKLLDFYFVEMLHGGYVYYAAGNTYADRA